MFSTLPAELLLSIASYLDDHTDTLHLAYCCHAFYRLLLPKVFKSLDLLNHRNGHLCHLVHKFISNPQFAREVRTLRVYNGWRPTSSVRYDQEPIHALLVAIFGPGDDLSAWERGLQIDQDNDAFLALLLHLLPNLESLWVQVHDVSNHTLNMLGRIAYMDKHFQSNMPLSNLREITVELWDAQGGIGTDDVLPIFRLPSLRSFHGKMICDGDNNDDSNDDDNEFDAAGYMPGNAGSSSVTHIDLRSSCSRKGFADLINAPKRLESFVFEHSNDPNLSEDEDVYASRFYPPLHKHRNSLQEIVLAYDESTGDEHYGWDYVGSFVDFPALKKLRLRSTSILDWEQWGAGEEASKNTLKDVLPPSLETLIIDGMQGAQMEELAKGFAILLSGGNPHCPFLRYVEITSDWMSEEQSTEESNLRPRPIPDMLPEYASFKDTIELLCSAAGVEFCLRDLHVEHIIEENRSSR
jgi:hypothetical protein